MGYQLVGRDSEDDFLDRRHVSGLYSFRETDGSIRRMGDSGCDCYLDFRGGALALLVSVEYDPENEAFCASFYLDWHDERKFSKRLFKTKMLLPLDHHFFQREKIMVRSGTYLRSIKDPEEGLIAFRTDVAHALLRGTVADIQGGEVKSVTVFGAVWPNGPETP